MLAPLALAPLALARRISYLESDWARACGITCYALLDLVGSSRHPKLPTGSRRSDSLHSDSGTVRYREGHFKEGRIREKSITSRILTPGKNKARF